MRFAFLSMVSVLALVACESADPARTATSAGAPIPEYEGYELVWHDEFDEGTRPDAKWSYEQGFVRNFELQWYQPDNATVENGCMVITARKEVVQNERYDSTSTDWRINRKQAEYTSACCITRDSYHFKYGRMEVRARIPVASGAWPAIWTLGNKYPWPANGEIDIMEYYLRPGPSILANACWQNQDTEATDAVKWDDSITPMEHFTDNKEEWADRFHVWRMDWDPDFIRLYIDGEMLNEINLRDADGGGGMNRDSNPFSNDDDEFGHYILLNLAIGQAGGTPDDSRFPLRYEIDYVRVYQQK